MWGQRGDGEHGVSALVVPADIPFDRLKGEDLESCVYWLLDSMGARDLEWRKGGQGAGAADGGRDLEATFYHAGPGGELRPESWWIECKGRKGTLEAEAVRSAAVNALARSDLGVLVIATNTTFSNPTRDWIREFSTKHPKPIIHLWDRYTLERQLSRQPSVVLRLFASALSLHGRLQAVRERFWNRVEYGPEGVLKDLWRERAELSPDAADAFALVVNEFGVGSIIHRPWAAFVTPTLRLAALEMGLQNAVYLAVRCQEGGARSAPIVRALAHLILASLDEYEAEVVAELVLEATGTREGKTIPQAVIELLLLPVLNQLQAELQDVCGSDCTRISADRRGLQLEEGDEVGTYWKRLEPEGEPDRNENRRHLRLEALEEPCVVGFKLDEEAHCPLFNMYPSVENLGELLTVFDRVAIFRKGLAKRGLKARDLDYEQ